MVLQDLTRYPIGAVQRFPWSLLVVGEDDWGHDRIGMSLYAKQCGKGWFA